jgi:hypothetical protein
VSHTFQSISMSKSALTPKAKGTGIGREVHHQGPMIMTPSGGFHPAPNMDLGGGDGDEENPEEFAFPIDDNESAAHRGPTMDSSSSSSSSSSSRAPGQGASAGVGSGARTRREYVERKLFGGAITMTLPASFEDVSTIRQVPDHQEVFVDQLTDMSLIVEILAFEEVSNEGAAQHFFDDLAQFNEVIFFFSQMFYCSLRADGCIL